MTDSVFNSILDRYEYGYRNTYYTGDKIMTATVDNYTRLLLTVIAVLLALTAFGLWCQAPTTLQTAQARIPDSGEQLNQLIEKVDNIDASLGELKQLLVSGKIKVQLVKPAETAPAKKSVVITPPSIRK